MRLTSTRAAPCDHSCTGLVRCRPVLTNPSWLSVRVTLGADASSTEISAKVNPAHLGTDMAEAVDIRRAWFATLERGDLLDPMALFKAYGQGLPVSTVAGERGVPSSTCEWRIYRDVAVLTGAINRGDRPNPNLRSIT